MANWYYADGDERRGPVEAAEIERLIASGQIAGDTLVWRQGLDGWEAASDHFATSGAAAVPPPISSAPPPVAPSPAQRPEPAASVGDLGSDGLYVGAPSRSFGEAISTCFRNYVTFSGRASRSEYWFFVLFLVLLSIGATLIDATLFPGSLTSESGGPVNAIATLATFLPSLAVGWRRLHDTDRSGWWIGGFYLALVAVGVLGFAVASSGNEDTAIAVFGLIGVAVIIYAIVMLVFFCQKGTPGPNRFG